MARKSAAPKTPKLRSYASNVDIKLGLLSLTGDLVPPRKSASSSGPRLEAACPTCHTGDTPVVTKLDQRYVCPANDEHGPFGQDGVLRSNGTTVVATAAEVTETRVTPLAEGERPVLELIAHYADEVEVNTVYSGVSYMFRPNQRNPLYPIMLAQLDGEGRINCGDPRPVILIGEINLRGHKKLFQLRTWKQNLLLQEVARPEDMHPIEPVVEAEDERFVDVFKGMVAQAIVPFDPANYADVARKRLAEFVEARSAADEPLKLEILTGGKEEAPAEDNSDDALLAMLQASLQQVAS